MLLSPNTAGEIVTGVLPALKLLWFDLEVLPPWTSTYCNYSPLVIADTETQS